MSLDQHDRAASRYSPVGTDVPVREAIAEAIASVRLEGLEPDAAGLDVLEEVAAGRMSIPDALDRVLAAARPV